MAFQLAHGYLVSGAVGRGDKVGHGFSLREVHLAVEVGSLGKLAGFSHAAAVFDKEFQYLI